MIAENTLERVRVSEFILKASDEMVLDVIRSLNRECDLIITHSVEAFNYQHRVVSRHPQDLALLRFIG